MVSHPEHRLPGHQAQTTYREVAIKVCMAGVCACMRAFMHVCNFHQEGNDDIIIDAWTRKKDGSQAYDTVL